jgi:hypothetical protein
MRTIGRKHVPLWQRVVPQSLQGPALLVIDDVDAFDEAALQDLIEMLAETPEMRALVTFRRRPASWPDLDVIEIGGFTTEQFDRLFAATQCVRARDCRHRRGAPPPV